MRPGDRSVRGGKGYDRAGSADDARLVAECLGGRAEAFGELVRRHQGRLYAAVCRLVRDPEDARDVVQEALLSAYAALAGYRGGARFSTWLCRIALNAAHSLLRRRRRAPGLPTRPGRTPELVDPAPGSDPARALEQAEQHRLLRQALARLAPEHRTALVMKEIEGHRYAAIAAVLRVPVGTVRSRLHRARLELRQLLRQGEDRPR